MIRDLVNALKRIFIPREKKLVPVRVRAFNTRARF
jgi:hypothetical protein